MISVIVDLDGALGDTRTLWAAWLAESEKVLGVAPGSLADDRGAAATALDAAGAGNWRTLLRRYAEERAPVYLRPSAEASAALRRLEAAGARIGVYTDAPEGLAQVALAQLGAGRRIDVLETGAGALERLRSAFGPEAAVLADRGELVAAAAAQRGV